MLDGRHLADLGGARSTLCSWCRAVTCRVLGLERYSRSTHGARPDAGTDATGFG